MLGAAVRSAGLGPRAAAEYARLRGPRVAALLSAPLSSPERVRLRDAPFLTTEPQVRSALGMRTVIHVYTYTHIHAHGLTRVMSSGARVCWKARGSWGIVLTRCGPPAPPAHSPGGPGKRCRPGQRGGPSKRGGPGQHGRPGQHGAARRALCAGASAHGGGAAH